MSNYPPGVTGAEYEISGPDREWEAPRLGVCKYCGWPENEECDRTIQEIEPDGTPELLQCGGAVNNGLCNRCGHRFPPDGDVIWQSYWPDAWWVCPECDEIVAGFSAKEVE